MNEEANPKRFATGGIIANKEAYIVGGDGPSDHLIPYAGTEHLRERYTRWLLERAAGQQEPSEEDLRIMIFIDTNIL